MGYLGKMLTGVAIGVGAVAAAPFTGGGSLLGGATLITSLTGAGVVATVAGAGGAVVGAVAQAVNDELEEDRIKEQRAAGAKDGMNMAREKFIKELKKPNDFYLAATALAYFFARCDGFISEAQQLEIDFDLDMVRKNTGIPDGIKNEIYMISINEKINFSFIVKYLDEVDVEGLNILLDDVDEIIAGSGTNTGLEEEARRQYVEYIERRNSVSK